MFYTEPVGRAAEADKHFVWTCINLWLLITVTEKFLALPQKQGHFHSLIYYVEHVQKSLHGNPEEKAQISRFLKDLAL